jgi:N-acyl-D-amino-acid deacylase
VVVPVIFVFNVSRSRKKQTYKEAKKMKTSPIKVMTSFFCASVLLSPIFTQDPSQAAFAAKKNEKVSLPVTSRTGLDSSKLDKLDDLMLKVMRANDIYAGQLAVSKNGKLVYSKALPTEHKVDTTCDSLFRIASSSKPITAVAIMTLVQQGKLTVEDKALDILKDYKPAAGEPFDPKLQTITVRHLLEHTSGFSNEKGDPQFEYLRLAAQKYSLPQPASPQRLFAIAKPLDRVLRLSANIPLGYNMLGRTIEKVSVKTTRFIKRCSKDVEASATPAWWRCRP